MGWSQMEKTDESGLWLFRGAPEKGEYFSFVSAAGDSVKRGSYHTACSVPCDSSCSCSCAYGQGPAIGPHAGERCWPLLAGVWSTIAPLDEALGVLRGGVPTAANLNLQWKGKSSSDNEATCAGLDMVTFLSWMANVRTSFFIARVPVWNRIGLTLRSVGSNNMFPPVPF